MNTKRTVKQIAMGFSVIAAIAMTTACTDAKVVSSNLSKAADNFELDRRIVFYNSITDTYLLTVEGKCSLKDQGKQLEIVCKVGYATYKKHFLGLSDNVTYIVEQLEASAASAYNYRVVFKPSVLLPDIDLRTK